MKVDRGPLAVVALGGPPPSRIGPHRITYVTRGGMRCDVWADGKLDEAWALAKSRMGRTFEPAWVNGHRHELSAEITAEVAAWGMMN